MADSPHGAGFGTIKMNKLYGTMAGDLGIMEDKVKAASDQLSGKDGDIAPSDLLEMQVNMTLYTTQLQMITSLMKGLGDAAKGVARNMS